MSTFGVQVLFFFAFVGTVMSISGVGAKLHHLMQGHTQEEVVAQLRQYIQEHGSGSYFLRGIGLFVYLMFSTLYMVIVMPWALVTAITQKIGFMPITYLMIIVTSIVWAYNLWHLIFGVRKPVITGTAEDDTGRLIPIIVDERYDWGRVPYGVIRILHAIPNVYLWYLFLIEIRRTL